MRRLKLVTAAAVGVTISMLWASSAGAQLLNFEGAVVSTSPTTGDHIQLFSQLFTGVKPDPKRTQLTDDGTNVTPSISSDGNQVLFASTRGGGVQVFQMQLDGSGQTQVTSQPGGAAEPSLFPGSVNEFVSSFAVGSDTEICRFNTATGGTTQLTNNTVGDNSPDVSPNGQSIVWQQGAPGPSEIWIMNSDGTNQTQLTNNGVTDSRPRFTPDGQAVVFSQGTPPNANIMSHDLTTGATTPLTSGNTDSNPVPFQGGVAFVRQTDAGGRLYAMGPAGETPGPLNGADIPVDAAGGMDVSRFDPPAVELDRTRLDVENARLILLLHSKDPVDLFVSAFVVIGKFGGDRGALPSKTKKGKFKAKTVDVPANEKTKVTLKASRKAERAIEAEAEAGKKLKLTIDMTATGSQGAVTTFTEKDKVKPK